MKFNIQWSNISTIAPKNYVCGYCGSDIASEKGFLTQSSGTNRGFIYVCHTCTCPSFFDSQGNQTPGSIYGESVTDIDDELVEKMYEEARNCMKVSAYTAAVLCCRKLLMHIAVSKGADEGKSFVYYVEYLSDNNYVPPGAKDWVDHIRAKGNEANHEIVIMKDEDAKDLISFCEMLLKLIYEFPANIKRKQNIT